jgi:hypothetical protein
MPSQRLVVGVQPSPVELQCWCSSTRVASNMNLQAQRPLLLLFMLLLVVCCCSCQRLAQHPWP